MTHTLTDFAGGSWLINWSSPTLNSVCIWIWDPSPSTMHRWELIYHWIYGILSSQSVLWCHNILLRVYKILCWYELLMIHINLLLRLDPYLDCQCFGVSNGVFTIFSTYFLAILTSFFAIVSSQPSLSNLQSAYSSATSKLNYLAKDRNAALSQFEIMRYLSFLPVSSC